MSLDHSLTPARGDAEQWGLPPPGISPGYPTPDDLVTEDCIGA